MAIDTTLDELRKQAEESETAAAETIVEDDNSTIEDAENPTSKGAETGEFELSLEDDEPASKQQLVPANVHVHKLQKAKARYRDAETKLSEVEQRLALIEARNANTLPSQQLQQQPQGNAKLPKLSDFDFDEDKFSTAMAEFLSNQAVSATQTQMQKHEHEQRLANAHRKLAASVDEHINRAGEFIRSNEKAGLSADLYLQAEEAVRTALDPDGKGIFDQIVAGIGEGSEKVTYYLGRNPSKLLDFQKSFRDDPGGVSVLLELGALKEKLIKRQKKGSSSAPIPDEALKGGSVTSGTSAGLLKKIKDAEDGGDVSALLKLRKQAREAQIKLD